MQSLCVVGVYHCVCVCLASLEGAVAKGEGVNGSHMLHSRWCDHIPGSPFCTSVAAGGKGCLSIGFLDTLLTRECDFHGTV